MHPFPERGSKESYSVQRAGCDQLTDILLSGWWWAKWESASSTFWLQPVWGLRACGRHIVHIFHPGGGFSICKTAQRIWFRLSLVLEGDLKVLDFVYWPKYYYFVLFDCFPFFLLFLSSLIKFILWLKFFYRQKAGRGHGWGWSYSVTWSPLVPGICKPSTMSGSGLVLCEPGAVLCSISLNPCGAHVKAINELLYRRRNRLRD